MVPSQFLGKKIKRELNSVDGIRALIRHRLVSLVRTSKTEMARAVWNAVGAPRVTVDAV